MCVKHLIHWVNALFKSELGAVYYELLSKFYPLLDLCEVLSPLMCIQRRITPHREVKKLLSKSWNSKTSISSCQSNNWTFQTNIDCPAPPLLVYKIISMQSVRIALRNQINFTPLSCLWIKAASCDMNARTWWSDYFNNTWEI